MDLRPEAQTWVPRARCRAPCRLSFHHPPPSIFPSAPVSLLFSSFLKYSNNLACLAPCCSGLAPWPQPSEASSPPSLCPWHYLDLSSASTWGCLTFFFALFSALPTSLGMSAVSQHTIFPTLNSTWLMEISQQKNGWRSCGIYTKFWTWLSPF